jgi:hypothetical protein
MLQSLNMGLQKTSKGRLWKEAMLYSTLVETVHTDLATEYKQFEAEFKTSKVFYKNRPGEIEVRITSQNMPFLTWLKTECTNIENFFIKKLISKNLFPTNQTFVLKCFSR